MGPYSVCSHDCEWLRAAEYQRPPHSRHAWGMLAMRTAPATQLYIHSRCTRGPSSFAVGTHPYTGASTQPLMGARLRGGGPFVIATMVTVVVVAWQHHRHG